MSDTANQVASLLAKLDSSLNRKKGGKQDWAKLSEARKKAFWKPKEGKNEILILTPAFGSDPFTFWGYHKGLQEVEYYSVPCDKMNKDEECIICSVVDDLKASGWKENQHLWMPIEQKTDTYAPIIDLSSAASIKEGPKWFRISKTVMNQLVENLKNLELDAGELPFYDQTQPQRILLTYDKNQAPATQYSCQFKNVKDVPSADQYAEWAGIMQPVGEYIFSKSQDDNKRLVDEYFLRIAATLDAVSDSEPQSEPIASAPDTSAAESKLSKLKK